MHIMQRIVTSEKFVRDGDTSLKKKTKELTKESYYANMLDMLLISKL